MNCQDHLYHNADPPRSPAAGSSSNAESAWGPSRWATCSAGGYARPPAGASRPSIRWRPRHRIHPQGQARDVPVHGRRTEPSGAVRQQAAAGEVRRHAAAAGADQGLSRPRSSIPTRSCSGPKFKFARHGQCGTELSELLPHLATVVDDIAIVKAMVTDAFNHAPARS